MAGILSTIVIILILLFYISRRVKFSVKEKYVNFSTAHDFVDDSPKPFGTTKRLGIDFENRFINELRN